MRKLTWRITLCMVIIVILGVVLGSFAQRSWQQTFRLQGQFSSLQSTTSQNAIEFKSRLANASLALLEWEATRGAAASNEFLKISNDVDEWLHQERQRTTNASSIQLLNELHVRFQDYLKDAHLILNSATPRPSNLHQRLREDTQKLRELDEQIARTQNDAFKQASSEIRTQLAQFKFALGSAILAITLLLAAISYFLYRDWISPLRRQLVRSHELLARQEKLSSLGVLAAGVAHEIRNPLTAIKARLFTQQRALTRHSPELEDNLVVQQEITRLERIVKDFLEFARPGEPLREPTRISSQLQNLKQLVAPGLSDQQIQLDVEILADPEITVDSGQLRQVLLNLVRNAAESIGRNGRIVVRSRTRVERSRGRMVPFAVIDVEDNGPGIPPEIQKRLFDPFFTTKERGTGLGLSLSARIMQNHGGTMEFRTQPGEGTTFSLCFPLQPEPQNPVSHRIPTEP